jgi:hypothetical protein
LYGQKEIWGKREKDQRRFSFFSFRHSDKLKQRGKPGIQPPGKTAEKNKRFMADSGQWAESYAGTAAAGRNWGNIVLASSLSERQTHWSQIEPNKVQLEIGSGKIYIKGYVSSSILLHWRVIGALN